MKRGTTNTVLNKRFDANTQSSLICCFGENTNKNTDMI